MPHRIRSIVSRAVENSAVFRRLCAWELLINFVTFSTERTSVFPYVAHLWRKCGTIFWTMEDGDRSRQFFGGAGGGGDGRWIFCVYQQRFQERCSLCVFWVALLHECRKLIAIFLSLTFRRERRELWLTCGTTGRFAVRRGPVPATGRLILRCLSLFLLLSPRCMCMCFFQWRYIGCRGRFGWLITYVLQPRQREQCWSVVWWWWH